MRYNDVLLKICALADDPAGDDLYERAKDHFATALKNSIDSGEFSDLDLFGFKKIKMDLVFTAHIVDLSALTILRIIQIYVNPYSNNDDVRVSMKTAKEIENINNTELSPSDYDLFIHHSGNTLLGYVSAASKFTIASDTLYMEYIEDPQGSTWDDNATTGTVLTSLFAENYLERLVTIAGGSLLAEDNL